MNGSGPEGRFSSWFSLARERGGPTYYPEQLFQCPDFVWNAYTVVCTVVFVSPILVFLVVLPSFRGKHWSSLMAVLLCFLTGFTLTVALSSSSWLVATGDVRASVGPRRPPVPGTVGVWAGLWHANLTYVTADLSLNEEVSWRSRADLAACRREALRKGWPWALVSLTAELGGEGSEWRGLLGDGVRQGGLLASCLLFASAYVWLVWVLLFAAAPELTARPLMLTGVLMALASLAYVASVGARVPRAFVVGGVGVVHVRLGFAWWLTGAVGSALTLAGAALLLLHGARSPKGLLDLDSGRGGPTPSSAPEESFGPYPDFLGQGRAGAALGAPAALREDAPLAGGNGPEASGGASAASSAFVRSCRRSVRRSSSKVLSRRQRQRLSARMTSRARSQSLSKLMLEEDRRGSDADRPPLEESSTRL